MQSSGNVTVMSGMGARLSCYFRSDLATATYWVRAKGDPDSPDFDRTDRNNFETIRDPKTGLHLMTNELVFQETHVNDSGLYICVGQNNVKR